MGFVTNETFVDHFALKTSFNPYENSIHFEEPAGNVLWNHWNAITENSKQL